MRIGFLGFKRVEKIAFGESNLAIGEGGVLKDVGEDGKAFGGFGGEDARGNRERVAAGAGTEVAASVLQLLGDLASIARCSALINGGGEQIGKTGALLGIGGVTPEDDDIVGNLREAGFGNKPDCESVLELGLLDARSLQRLFWTEGGQVLGERLVLLGGSREADRKSGEASEQKQPPDSAKRRREAKLRSRAWRVEIGGRRSVDLTANADLGRTDLGD